MATKPKKTEGAARRKPVRAVEEAHDAAKEAQAFAQALSAACAVCERGTSVARFKNITFSAGRFQAHDGVVQFQARSVFAPESEFVLSEEKLAQALSLIAPVEKVKETAEQVRFSRGPLSVAVKKLPIDQGFYESGIKLTKAAHKADGLLEAIKTVAPFMSEDATRPWSVSVMLKGSWALATNNLALVRSPVHPIFDEPVSIPLPAVRIICTLPSIDYIEKVDNAVTLSSGKLLYRFRVVEAEWPDVSKFFDKMPKKMPPLPPEMKAATATASRLSDRFAEVSDKRIEASSAVMDVSYEVEFSKGKGRFSAKLLASICDCATHADFSMYPQPVFFRGDRIEGTAIGLTPTTTEEK